MHLILRPRPVAHELRPPRHEPPQSPRPLIRQRGPPLSAGSRSLAAERAKWNVLMKTTAAILVVSSQWYWRSSFRGTCREQPALRPPAAPSVRTSRRSRTRRQVRSISHGRKRRCGACARHRTRPAHLGDDRHRPIEFQSYRIEAELVTAILEKDSDIHLVIVDPGSRRSRCGTSRLLVYRSAAYSLTASAASPRVRAGTSRPSSMDGRRSVRSWFHGWSRRTAKPGVFWTNSTTFPV